MTALRSWVAGADGSGFPAEHLPYGVVSTASGPPRVGVRIGDHVLDLARLADDGVAGLGGLLEGTAARPALNDLMALGPARWEDLRARLVDLVCDTARRPAVEPALLPVAGCMLHLPVEVADYVDFYSSIEHATNLGRLFRPDGDPLLPNWRHLPVAYHGRAGTVVVSGTPVPRPAGQRRVGDDVVFGPSERLDIELEVGTVIGVPSPPGRAVPVGEAMAHVFGLVLVDDWSARDIQAWEYQPLGPFLGKSFATSVSHWVVPLDQLADRRVAREAQEPQPLDYLREEPWAYDIPLEVELNGTVVARSNTRHLYWSIAQQLAHLTVNGASLRTGDLLATGTISGPEPEARGSLIELSWNGEEPIELPGGSIRAFLEDGDQVVLRGEPLGEVRGRIEPAREGR